MVTKLTTTTTATTIRAVTSSGCNYVFCAMVCILFVFLRETLKMEAEMTETCGSIVICDKNYFVDVHLFVCY